MEGCTSKISRKIHFVVEYSLNLELSLVDFFFKKVYNLKLWFFSRTGRIVALQCHNWGEESPDTRLFSSRQEAAGTG